MRPEYDVHTPARLIVCERTGKWAVALRRASTAVALRVYETRSTEECQEEVAASPDSFVAVEATAANLARIAGWLNDVRLQFPRCRLVVLGSRGMESCQWLLREAGAAHVIHSSRQSGEVIRMALRQLRSAATRPRSVHQQVWERLPW